YFVFFDYITAFSHFPVANPTHFPVKNMETLSVSIQTCPDKAHKQRVRLVGTALEFRVELNTHMEGSSGKFHRFHQTAIGRCSAEHQPSLGQLLAVIVIKFVPVTVPLLN